MFISRSNQFRRVFWEVIVRKHYSDESTRSERRGAEEEAFSTTLAAGQAQHPRVLGDQGLHSTEAGKQLLLHQLWASAGMALLAYRVLGCLPPLLTVAYPTCASFPCLLTATDP